MASWREMSGENRRAAVLLRKSQHGQFRASASRAYYAVYHEVTHQLVESGFTNFGLIAGRQRRNPQHEKLAKLVAGNIFGLSAYQRREL